MALVNIVNDRALASLGKLPGKRGLASFVKIAYFKSKENKP
jgi:hypothetical protein